MKKTFPTKKIILGLAILSLGFFSSCKNEDPAPASQPAVTTTEPVSNTSETDGESSNVKINPAHGLPGHRCDIPVGAPLSSATTMQRTSTNNPSSSSVSPIRVDQSPRINPPHGQPGHDCSVPVGAALQ